ncbi:MAG: hypothetical protein JNM00_06895 [Flavobacteriales bacterium]|nr:hypothetical protein [Flavobacteriales bacterium]
MITVPKEFHHPIPVIPEAIKHRLTSSMIMALHFGDDYVDPPMSSARNNIYRLTIQKIPDWQQHKSWIDAEKERIAKANKRRFFLSRILNTNEEILDERRSPFFDSVIKYQRMCDQWNQNASCMAQDCYMEYLASLSFDKRMEIMYGGIETQQ